MTKNILISGGNFENIGAKAMTLLVIENIRKEERYKNYQIYLITAQKIEKKYLKKYKIKNFILDKKTLLLDFLFLLRKKEKTILKNSSICFDVSGLCLSSKMLFRNSIFFLYTIFLSKKYFYEFFILPQSIGPFDYNFFQKIFLIPMIEYFLKIPKKIYLRENHGFNLLKKYKIGKIEKKLDLTLILKTNQIFKKEKLNKINYKEYIIIIPNMNILSKLSKQEYLNFLKKIILKLKNKNKIYLAYSCLEDEKICKSLKENFKNDKNVIFFENKNLSLFKLKKLIQKSKYLILSRYHSLLFSYQLNKSCIVLSWAIKYEEIMNYYKQQNYLINLNKNLEKNTFEKIDIIEKNYKNESLKIRKINHSLKKINFYDLIK